MHKIAANDIFQKVLPVMMNSTLNILTNNDNKGTSACTIIVNANPNMNLIKSKRFHNVQKEKPPNKLFHLEPLLLLKNITKSNFTIFLL